MLLNSSRRKQFKPNRFDEKFSGSIMEETRNQCSTNYSLSNIQGRKDSNSSAGKKRQTSTVCPQNGLVQNVSHCSSSLEKAKKNVRRSYPIEKSDKSDSEFNSNDKRSRQDEISTSPAFSTVSPCPTVSMKIGVEQKDCGTLFGDRIERNLKRQSPKISTSRAIIAEDNGDEIFAAATADKDDENLGNTRFKNRSVSKEKDQGANGGGHCFNEELKKTVIKQENYPKPELMPYDRSNRNDDCQRKISDQNRFSESPKNQTSPRCCAVTCTEIFPRRPALPTDRLMPAVVHAPPSALDGNKVVSPTSAIVETPKLLSKNFPCQLCGTRFSNSNILEAHQSFYCSQRSTTVSQISQVPLVRKNVTPENRIVQERPSSSSSSLSGNFLPPTTATATDEPPPTPSTIFLPCLYTDSNVPMQIIGYPQTVIPVAVSKRYEKSLGAALSSKHVTLDAALLAGLTVDVNHVIVPLKTSIGDDGRSAMRYEFSRPSATTTVGQQNLSKVLERANVENSEAKIFDHSPPCRIRQEEHPRNQCGKSPISQPVMLPPTSQNVAFLPAIVQQWKMLTSAAPAAAQSSQHGHRSTKSLLYPLATATDQQQQLSSGQFLFLKAFPCPHCSASFSSQKTLDGHLNFYCLAKPQNPGPSSSSAMTKDNVRYENISRFDSLNCLASPANEKDKVPRNDQPKPKKRKSDLVNHAPEADQSSSNIEQKSVKKRPLFLCEICRKAFREKLIFDNHKCDDNRLKLRSILTLKTSSSRRHRRQRDNYFRCKYCHYQSQYKGNLKRHVILVHRDEHGLPVGNNAASTSDQTIHKE